MAKPLDDQQLRDALATLPLWQLSGDKLTRQFQFGGFQEAMSFLVRVGMQAEQLGHHPEIWNVYDRVRLSLTTHDAGDRVTELDVALAGAIDGFEWTRFALPPPDPV